MRSVLLVALLLLPAIAATGQTEDSDIPVLRRRPAPADSGQQPSTTPDTGSQSSATPDTGSQSSATPDTGTPPSATPDSGPQNPATPEPPAAPPAAPDVAPAPDVPTPSESHALSTTRDVILTRSGGVLRVTVADADDTDGAGQIGLRLRDAAAQYGRGEFGRAGAQAPGTAVLRQLRDRIIYTAHAIAGGAELIISSHDRKAVEAIHQFLESQR